jgi:hypothetical protein
MNILNNYQPIKSISAANISAQNTTVKPKEYKKDVLDIFSEKVVNKRDLEDMVTVPRTIFKGYLCFTAGTMVNAIAGMLKNDKIKKGLGIAGSLISIYGTFNFVKPFLIKGKE